ncbi:MAG: hypothetical protein ISN29_03250 [Gammaproteobacteria bacterium AqS3]|nr:hypothetical protein [Gammaproteobacteria bacterium AqS3]
MKRGCRLTGMLLLFPLLLWGQDDPDGPESLYRIELILIGQTGKFDEAHVEVEPLAPPGTLFQISDPAPSPWVGGPEKAPAPPRRAPVVARELLGAAGVTLNIARPEPLNAAAVTSADSEDAEEEEPEIRYRPVALYAPMPLADLAQAPERLAQRGYSVLLQRSWVQLIRPTNPPLYIAGGDAARQVEGWIALRRSRYLHLDLNLQGTQGDPDPDPVAAPVIPTDWEAEQPETAFSQVPCGLYEAPELIWEPQIGGGSLLPDAGLDEGELVSRCTARSDELFQGSDTPWVMRTSRRMQSGETHFIDHPMFSMIVRIVPHPLEPLTEEDALQP